MVFCDAVFFEGFVMRASAITFMFFKTILGEFFCERDHAFVARDFCDNRRECNREFFFISFYNCLLIEIPRRRAKRAV